MEDFFANIVYQTVRFGLEGGESIWHFVGCPFSEVEKRKWKGRNSLSLPLHLRSIYITPSFRGFPTRNPKNTASTHEAIDHTCSQVVVARRKKVFTDLNKAAETHVTRDTCEISFFPGTYGSFRESLSEFMGLMMIRVSRYPPPPFIFFGHRSLSFRSASGGKERGWLYGQSDRPTPQKREADERTCAETIIFCFRATQEVLDFLIPPEVITRAKRPLLCVT